MNCQKILDEFRRVAQIKGWSALHTPQNLIQALTVEVAELQRAMLPPSGGSLEAVNEPRNTQAVADELADVQMYLLVLADSLNISLEQAVESKQAYNRQRFEHKENSDHG